MVCTSPTLLDRPWAAFLPTSKLTFPALVTLSPESSRGLKLGVLETKPVCFVGNGGSRSTPDDFLFAFTPWEPALLSNVSIETTEERGVLSAEPASTVSATGFAGFGVKMEEFWDAALTLTVTGRRSRTSIRLTCSRRNARVARLPDCGRERQAERWSERRTELLRDKKIWLTSTRNCLSAGSRMKSLVSM